MRKAATVTVNDYTTKALRYFSETLGKVDTHSLCDDIQMCQLKPWTSEFTHARDHACDRDHHAHGRDDGRDLLHGSDRGNDLVSHQADEPYDSCLPA